MFRNGSQTQKTLVGVLALGVVISSAVSAGVAKGALVESEQAASEPVRDGERIDGIEPGQTLSVECWQAGVKIISESDLDAISIDTLIEESKLSFARRARDGRESGRVHILSLDWSTCLVKPAD